MALVLRLRIGQDFFVGAERVVVSKLLGGCRFELQTNGRTYEIRDDEAVELLPEVMISSGGRVHARVARVAIDAPREIPIHRGASAAKPPCEAQVQRVNIGKRYL